MQKPQYRPKNFYVAEFHAAIANTLTVCIMFASAVANTWDRFRNFKSGWRVNKGGHFGDTKCWVAYVFGYNAVYSTCMT